MDKEGDIYVLLVFEQHFAVYCLVKFILPVYINRTFAWQNVLSLSCLFGIEESPGNTEHPAS